VLGVVRFQVHVPGVGPNYIEPLSSNLACRIENLLILSDKKKQLKVIRGIGAQASLRSKGLHSDSELFRYKYDLAWGKERFKPDAFLYGSVKFTASLKVADVTIECQDAETKKTKLASFKVKVDRNVLADAGLSFTINDKGWEKSKSVELDDLARIEAVKARKSDTGARPPARLVKLEALHNDEVLAATRGSYGEMQLGARKIDGKWAFKLTNTSKAEVGVVLRVGGCGAVEKEAEQLSCCRRVLLGPGKSVTLRGHLLRDSEGKHDFRVHRIEGLSRSGSNYAPQLEGLFELAVFRTGKEEDGLEKKSLRGLGITGPPQKELARRDLETKLRAHGGLPLDKISVRSAVLPDVRGGEKPSLDGPTMKRPRFVEFQRYRVVMSF
jgi:hypothetical protein